MKDEIKFYIIILYIEKNACSEKKCALLKMKKKHKNEEKKMKNEK